MTDTIHATGLLVGRIGVLIRGPSGSGKSQLAADLIEETRRNGGFAALVADDRVAIAKSHGRLIARAPAAIAGRIEVRGFGIERVDHEPAAVVRLVVDLVDPTTVERIPEPEALWTHVAGVRLARIAVPQDRVQALPAIRACIRALSAGENARLPSI
ncbi:HPr kinase/phosphorylase [Amorphus sp. 3PC139-8]|uniref:HPr kinase/phosphorylase n=1 Tax=Amorphus sp. 3PC139-8 TaxID=2735676 RepID=UPI00345D4015